MEHDEPWLTFDALDDTIHATKKRERIEYDPFDTYHDKKIKTHDISQDDAHHKVEVLKPSVLFRYKPRLKHETQSYLHVTSLSGETFYALYDDREEEDVAQDIGQYHFDSSYLGMSMEDIKREAEQLGEFSSFLKDRNTNTNSTGSKDQLWVDLYAPKKYLELLSDQKLNRTLFDWIREWDPCVFKKKSESGKDRPDSRIVLLSGPPGIGKTTLAHLIAKRAGYEVVEFNASDDRTGQRFMAKVHDVVDNSSISFQTDPTPKCLIIDEIDGTYHNEGKSAIDVLLRLIDDKAKTKLKRPIICICNDLWAPSLRKLRDRALILKVEPPQISVLVDRLQNVCLKEGVRVDQRTLQTLCEMNHCDVRSCLNTLQFLAKKNKVIQIDTFLTTSFGQKDMGGNIFEIWRTIFLDEDKSTYIQSLYASKQNQGVQWDSRKANRLCRSKLDQICEVMKNENMDLILQGVHENMLTVKYHDPLLKRTMRAMEWFQLYDTLNSAIFKSQQYSLLSFIPFVAVGIYQNIKANYLEKPFQYPKADRLARTMKKENKNILKTFFHKLNPRVKSTMSEPAFLLDILSHFLRIIAPDIRPIAVNLLEDQEKRKLLDLVQLYIRYGLDFEEVKGSNIHDYPNYHDASSRPREFGWRPTFVDLGPKHQYQLRPPIHVLNHFTLQKELTVLDKTNDTQRQVLSHQIALQKNGKMDASPSTLITSLQPKLEAIPKEQPVKNVRRDFFGRIIEDKKEEKINRASQETVVKAVFKYHEGKTDAVRRKVFMKDLL